MHIFSRPTRLSRLALNCRNPYDANGNTTTKTDSTGTTDYSWDFENRLTSATPPGSGGTVQFSYDPLNPNKNALMEFGDRGLEILGPVPIMLIGIGLVALYIRTQRRKNRTSLSWSPCNSS